MNIVIVDDDRKAGEMLAEKLSHYEGTTINGIAVNGTDGMKLVQETRPDLLFLDIELPDISGMEFLERIDEYSDGRCRVVMYTAHDRFMLSAFRNKAFDYLMKPVDDNELRGILRRACIDRRPHVPASLPVRTAADADSAEAASQEGVTRRNDGKFLFYTNAADFRLVDIRDVGVFAYNHDTRIWELTISGLNEPIKLKRNVNSDMILALNDSLIRVSQKHIINLGYLMEVADNTCRFFPPFDSINDVKVGRQFRKKLIERFSGF